jgi:acetyl esterase/lipase
VRQRVRNLARATVCATLVAAVCATTATPAGAQSTPAVTPPPLPRLNAHDIDTLPVKHGGVVLQYGPDSLQFGRLRRPAHAVGLAPLAVVIHGGCYLSTYASEQNTAAIADALTDAGFATWNIEYRRYDDAGGGWPGTFDDAAAAADYVRSFAARIGVDTMRIVVVGHSAGGQLALWLASRARARTNVPSPRSVPGAPTAPLTPLPIAGVVALGAITDLREFYARERRTCGNPAVESVLGGAPDEVPERVRAVSPIEPPALHVPVVLIAGELDGVAPRPVLERYQRARGHLAIRSRSSPRRGKDTSSRSTPHARVARSPWTPRYGSQHPVGKDGRVTRRAPTPP